jgi:starch synthase
VPPEVVLQSFREDVRPFVRVVPRAPEADVIDAYRRHDVLLFPSTYEGFGLVLLEAMSQRMAVVSTPVGCALALIRDGVTGLSVPLRDATAIAAAAARLLCNGALRQALGERARTAVAALSWRATALATLAAYERARAAING